jgi:hypothetical protein
MRALFNSRLNGVLTVQGLFDDQLESFSAVEEERPSSSVLTLALGFLAGIILIRLLGGFILPITLHFLGIYWLPGSWLWWVSLLGGMGMAAVLSALDKRGTSKYLVPLCYLVALLCLLTIGLVLWFPEYFRTLFSL